MKGLGKGVTFGGNSSDELRIDALAPVEGQAGQFRRICFPASLVSYLIEFEADVSGIVLHSGVTIPVALGFAELKKQVYEPDFRTGSSIDLTLVTGARVREVERAKLSKSFNPVSEKGEGDPGSQDFKLRLFARFNQLDRQFHCVEINNSQIAYFEPNHNRKEFETFIRLSKPVMGHENLWVTMPLSTFAQWVLYAKKQGIELIDLSEHTRPRNDRGYRMD